MFSTLFSTFFLTVGPFSSGDMKKWFDAGYFTMDLMVRRACDAMLLPLGEAHCCMLGCACTRIQVLHKVAWLDLNLS